MISAEPKIAGKQMENVPLYTGQTKRHLFGRMKEIPHAITTHSRSNIRNSQSETLSLAVELETIIA
jgi:hypothetical protein